MDKKKVIVQFIEAGQGHIVTAEAIAEWLEKKYSDKIEVIRDYAFRDSGDKDLQNFKLTWFSSSILPIEIFNYWISTVN